MVYSMHVHALYVQTDECCKDDAVWMGINSIKAPVALDHEDIAVRDGFSVQRDVRCRIDLPCPGKDC